MASIAQTVPAKAAAVLEEVSRWALAEAPLALVTTRGARLMLQVALEAEVMAFLQPGWRHGSQPRTVKVAGGDVTLARPPVRGARQPVHSRLLPPSTTRLEALEAAIPLRSLHGRSTRRVRKAVGQRLGKRGLSQTTVLRLPPQLVEAFQQWRQRDLSSLDGLSLFLDGLDVGVRAGTREKEAILVAHAVLADGRREIRAVARGSREATRAWMDLLEDLKRRRLRDPVLLSPDGGGGLRAAVEGCFPEGPRQPCTRHKLASVLAKVPRGVQAEVGDVARRALAAPPREQAEEDLRLFERAYQKRFPSAVDCLHRAREACWTSYRFPVSHWKRIRTTTVLGRSFRDVRRRGAGGGSLPRRTAGAGAGPCRAPGSPGWLAAPGHVPGGPAPSGDTARATTDESGLEDDARHPLNRSGGASPG